jgi:nitrogen-specific signal transduction histidine kinase
LWKLGIQGLAFPQIFKEKSLTLFLPPNHQEKVLVWGLSISHNIIVQKHKGKIAVYSRPGETCFEIKLLLNFEAPPIEA